MIEIGVFQTGRFEGAEIEEQMQCFAEEVRPLLARACGGQVENPSSGSTSTPSRASYRGSGLARDATCVPRRRLEGGDRAVFPRGAALGRPRCPQHMSSVVQVK